MTLCDWIGERLHEDNYGRPTGVTEVITEGPNSLRAIREDLPPAAIYCAEPNIARVFTPDDLDAALEEMADIQFVVVTKATTVTSPTYTKADALGIAVGGLGTLQDALGRLPDVGAYKSKNHEYVQRRLSINRNIEAWRRVGYDAYEIERPGGLRNLVIITLNPYEVTQEEVYRLIEAYPEIDVDALVNTNSSCHGFSRATLDAVSHAGVEITTFPEFLSSLRDPWES
ncbi:hypothetical protein DFJ68_2124 [Terracoccus luteus]|uniref:Uncharacterized protein n=1 Tax=Terracoccus luteus TaxID=53356 RepID=A0A495XZU7_9MICO|nr:hypothetical protein [Terracoccus luteus]RKT78675.1 hypothetical protein DFJ68_2124 [Terracoccus luteus]